MSATLHLIYQLVAAQRRKVCFGEHSRQFSIALNLGSCPVWQDQIWRQVQFHSRYSSDKKSTFCRVHRSCIIVTSSDIFYVIFIPCLESLLILAIVSIERYIAMKYSLKYANIVTTPRLIGAVICSWHFSAIYYISLIIPATSSTYSGLIVYVIVSTAIFIIVFCHTTVYFVSRRHMNHIKTQYLSSETTSNFLEERKALKTTSLILVSLFLSYGQGILNGLFRFVGVLSKSYSEAQIRLLGIAFLCIF